MQHRFDKITKRICTSYKGSIHLTWFNYIKYTSFNVNILDLRYLGIFAFNLYVQPNEGRKSKRHELNSGNSSKQFIVISHFLIMYNRMCVCLCTLLLQGRGFFNARQRSLDFFFSVQVEENVELCSRTFVNPQLVVWQMFFFSVYLMYRSQSTLCCVIKNTHHYWNFTSMIKSI